MRIKELRLRANLTQLELAERLNLTQGAVYQWELGATQPEAKRLPDLAKALGCTISDLFEKAGNE